MHDAWFGSCPQNLLEIARFSSIEVGNFAAVAFEEASQTVAGLGRGGPKWRDTPELTLPVRYPLRRPRQARDYTFSVQAKHLCGATLSIVVSGAG